MLYLLLKTFLSALLIVAIAELGKRSTFLGALLASLPLVSILAMLLLYIDTGDASQVASLARSIFWLVLPSLLLFITLPLLVRMGWGFYSSLTFSIALTAGAYLAMILVFRKLGITL